MLVDGAGVERFADRNRGADEVPQIWRSWWLQFEGVIERALSGIWVDAVEPMALIEALRVNIFRIDVDLDRRDARLFGVCDQQVDHRSTKAMTPTAGRDIEFVKESHRSVVPDVGPQRDESDSRCRLADQVRDCAGFGEQ